MMSALYCMEARAAGAGEHKVRGDRVIDVWREQRKLFGERKCYRHVRHHVSKLTVIGQKNGSHIVVGQQRHVTFDCHDPTSSSTVCAGEMHSCSDGSCGEVTNLASSSSLS
ncbi:hypothetical protein KSP39_PZI010982 [Platanthera zijinensis]|uniref:Uncharacterized protein n=1 Tax=Platanthera zijinensis TaxID=2320716 RepID=A0AAP0G5F3_9ASPA